ncbi:MAG TPA: two-component regulator propeller domain-containing protein, partial [Bryobacteraceae bacterium]|nr:two-component regulator propeller domain-containing protein [Bryobacteraceae bacterium]
MVFVQLVFTLVLGLSWAGASAPDTVSYSWRYYRPGNTGIQGDINEAIWIGPDGDPYIGGYDASFEEGGFAKFIQSENRWENYSNVDYPVIGHPNDQGTVRVRDIVPDASGKLWIGTWRGALTFDPAIGASSLTHYGPGNSALIDDFVWDIDRAPDGTMWFVNNGIVRYNPATDSWTQWNTGNVFLSAQPKPGGGYLIWSSDRPPAHGFTFVFDSDTQAWTTFTPTGAPGEVVSMPGKDCVDEAGNFWALRTANPGDYDSLDYRQPDGTWVTPPEPYASVTYEIPAFKAYGNGRALLVDSNGVVWQFDGSAWSSLGQWRPGAFSYSADIDAAGNVWVSGVGGAAKRDAQTGQWQNYRITNTANFDSFNRDITIDPDNGYVYTGANAGPGVGGMVRFDGSRWTGWNQLTYGLGYEWPFLNDSCEALAYRPSNASVAVSPDLTFYGIHEWTGAAFNPLLAVGGAKRMCEDSMGRLWAIGEYYSLSYYDGSVWTNLPIVGWGSKIQKDPSRSGTIWAATDYEIQRTDGSYTLSRSISDFPGAATWFTGLAADANGIAWIGTLTQFTSTGSTLIRLDANTGLYQMFRHDQGWPFPGEHVRPLAITPDGR